MAPIHDTDVAKERWEKSQWRSFELWEKIKIKELKRRRLWIIATIIVFILLSSIPSIIQRKPKWETLRIARQLADELNHLKVSAGLNNKAYELVFLDPMSLSYQIYEKQSCDAAEKTLINQKSILGDIPQNAHQLVTPSQGVTLNLSYLVESFCYDPLGGYQAHTQDQSAFAFIPVNDLTERRLDRVSVVFIQNESAQISFK